MPQSSTNINQTAPVRLPARISMHTQFFKPPIAGAPITRLPISKIQPSGTAGAAASAAPSASPTAAPSAVPSAAPSDPPHIPQQQITASSSSGSPSPSTTLRTTSSPSPSPSTAQAPPSSSWSPTPSAVVTTVLGSIKTVIVTPTVPPPAQTQVATVNAAAPDNFWNDTEKVAGTFTAVAVVIAALIGIILFLLVRRARSHESMAIRSTSDGDNTSVTQVPYGGEKRSSKLTLATAGLGGMRRGDSNDKNTGENTPASMSRRASMPLVRDQRLDPRVLFNIENANASHTSITSFRDDRDYSRPVLHVRNPD
ncbi:MAG: hypothetical protein LQ340_005908 [Diploschistes diacapsis]|nr:MAG: hypothetical protein LQ340_005908 [Diploschistes diacapsis]